MEALSPQHPSTAADPQQDLYCLQCGYNLRGLSGDPRRCPECGFANPMGDLELPAELISRQLRRMETAPTICLGAALFVLLNGGWILAAIRNGGQASEMFFCCSTPAVIGILTWIMGTAWFRSACQKQPGWGRALVWCHWYGLVLLFPIAGVILLSWLFLRQPGYHDQIGSLLWALPIGFSLVGYLLARRAHRKIKQTIYPLQRQTAVSLARDRLRRTLRDQTRSVTGGR